MTEAIELACVSSVTELEALGPAWRDLQDACAHQHVLMDHRWILAWWRRFGTGASQRTLVLKRAGRPAGILPLALTRSMEQFPMREPYVTGPDDYRHLPYLRFRRIAPIRRLSFPLGIATGNIRGQAIFPADAPALYRSAALFASETSSTWDVAVWPGLRRSAGEDVEVVNAARSAGLTPGSRRILRPMLSIDLSKSFDGFMRDRSSNFRKRMPKECNKLARTFAYLGPMRVRAYRRSGIAEGISILCALERMSWKVEDAKDRRLHLELDDVSRAFFREVAERFAADDQAQVLVLYFGETPAAAMFTLERSGVAACVLTYRNERLGESVAITPIWRELLSNSIERGLRKIDINGYARNYLKWANGQEDYVQAIFFSRQPYSSLLYAIDEAAVSLRRWLDTREKANKPPARQFQASRSEADDQRSVAADGGRP